VCALRVLRFCCAQSMLHSLQSENIRGRECHETPVHSCWLCPGYLPGHGWLRHSRRAMELAARFGTEVTDHQDGIFWTAGTLALS